MNPTDKPKNTIKRALLCTLNNEERRNYGIKLATTLDDIEAVETDKKRTNDHFKDRIAGLSAAADELKRKVSTGQEWRDVECEIRYCQPDPEHRQVIRMDTQEIVATELMTDADKQLKLSLVDDLDEDEDEAPDADADGDAETDFEREVEFAGADADTANAGGEEEE